MILDSFHGILLCAICFSIGVTYTTYILENGDKFFVSGTTLGQQNPAGKRVTVNVGHITGGTGKFSGIQGMTRSSGLSDGKAGQTATDTEVEYWFEK